MLVLSRKPGEMLTIGNAVYVQVLSVDGQRVKLGIDAPLAIQVLREEVVRRRTRSQSNAACAVRPK